MNKTAKRPGCLADTAGSTSVEYAVVLCLVTLGGALAVAALGPSLIERFRLVQLLIGLPVP